MATPVSIKAKLAEYEYLIRLQMDKIQELAEENEKLRSGLNAHGVLKLIYSDETASQSNRLKAAGLALAHETPRLMPVQQLELKAEEPPEPLADLVARRRARQDQLCPASVDQRRSDDHSNKVLDVVPVASSRHNGNGDDSND